VRGSGMQVAFITILPLGFGLDLMAHKVLMHMRGRARCRAVVLACRGPEPVAGWKCAQGKQSQGCGELRWLE
jgi:hypothetical protein